MPTSGLADALKCADFDALARRVVEEAKGLPVSKFSPCLPPVLAAALIAERLTDAVGAKRLAAQSISVSL